MTEAKEKGFILLYTASFVQRVTAGSEQEAVEKALSGEFSVTDGEYIPDSFRVDRVLPEEPGFREASPAVWTNGKTVVDLSGALIAGDGILIQDLKSDRYYLEDPSGTRTEVPGEIVLAMIRSGDVETADRYESEEEDILQLCATGELMERAGKAG